MGYKYAKQEYIGKMVNYSNKHVVKIWVGVEKGNGKKNYKRRLRIRQNE